MLPCKRVNVLQEDIPPLKQTLTDVENEFQKGIILKALDDDKTIIGSVRAFCDNETVYIGKLMVHPSKQGQGIGKNFCLKWKSSIRTKDMSCLSVAEVKGI